MKDIRDKIFEDIAEREFRAVLIPEQNGCLSGVDYAIIAAEEIGISLTWFFNEGDNIKKGEPICRIVATPGKIAVAEEKIIGTLAKYSGIATAAQEAVKLSAGKSRIVSGSSKKMPPEIKEGIRKAIVAGGATFRISKAPMVYFDKNYIRMLGSIPAALSTVSKFDDLKKVIQIKGMQLTVEEETEQALENGCDIIMVDTGNVEDLVRCSGKAKEMGKRKDIEIAFASGVRLDQIQKLIGYDVDIICIGKEIIDAQLLDMKLEVEI